MPLGEVCDVLDKLRKPITKRDRQAGPYPYYGASGVLDHVSDFIFDEPLILIGEDGAKWEAGENSAFPVVGKVWVNNHAHVIRPHRDTVLDNWIIYYLNGEDLLPYVSGLTVPKLNQKALRSIPIPLPPLSEQRRIVSVLDAAFAGLATATANTQKNLQNAREFFESVLDHAVSNHGGQPFDTEPIADIVDDIYDRRGVTPKKLGSDFTDSGHRVISAKSIRHRAINMKQSDVRFVDDETYGKWMSTTLVPGDVLLTSEAPLGEPAYIHEHLDWCIGQRLFCLRTNPLRMIGRFLFWAIQSEGVRRELFRRATGATAQGIRQKLLREVPIPVPPLSKQKEIVHELDEIKLLVAKTLERQERKLAALSELKQSILHRAFRGELSGSSHDESLATSTSAPTSAMASH